MKLSAAPLAMFALLATSCGDVQTTTDSGVADARAVDGADADTDADAALNNIDGGNPDAMLACTTPAECEDGNFCNGLEQCTGNECVPGAAPNLDDGVACTVDTCNETTDAVDNTPDDSLCGDNDLCNGVETCDAKLGCRPGTPACPADNACQTHSCISATGNCVTRDVVYSIATSHLGNPGATYQMSCGDTSPVFVTARDNRDGCDRSFSCAMNGSGGLRVRVTASPTTCSTVQGALVTTGCSTSGRTTCCFR